jgi:hypothetical protein
MFTLVQRNWFIVIRAAREAGRGRIIKKLETESQANDYLQWWKDRYFNDDDKLNLNIWVIHSENY